MGVPMAQGASRPTSSSQTVLPAASCYYLCAQHPMGRRGHTHPTHLYFIYFLVFYPPSPHKNMSSMRKSYH